MKYFPLLLTFLFSATLFAQENDDYLTQLKNHRTALDQTFGDTSKSILPQEMALKFKQLNYFKPNPKFNITAKFKKAIGKAFTMTTSSGKNKLFRQYGILSFEIDKKVFFFLRRGLLTFCFFYYEPLGALLSHSFRLLYLVVQNKKKRASKPRPNPLKTYRFE